MWKYTPTGNGNEYTESLNSVPEEQTTRKCQEVVVSLGFHFIVKLSQVLHKFTIIMAQYGIINSIEIENHLTI